MPSSSHDLDVNGTLSEFFADSALHLSHTICDVPIILVEERRVSHGIRMRIAVAPKISMSACLGHEHAGGVNSRSRDMPLINSPLDA